MPLEVRRSHTELPWVEGVEERVTFEVEEYRSEAPDAVYVFYPGLTVVGTRLGESSTQETL